MDNKSKSVKSSRSTFEEIKQVNEDGQESWSARKLAKVLGYSEYRHFLPVVRKAKQACQTNGRHIEDHFVDVNEMVKTGSDAHRGRFNVRISRYGCYLVVQNADPSKEIGGTMPENLPTAESIKVLERKKQKGLK